MSLAGAWIFSLVYPYPVSFRMIIVIFCPPFGFFPIFVFFYFFFTICFFYLNLYCLFLLQYKFSVRFVALFSILWKFLRPFHPRFFFFQTQFVNLDIYLLILKYSIYITIFTVVSRYICIAHGSRSSKWN